MADYIEGKRPLVEALRTHVPFKVILMADNVKHDSLIADIERKAKRMNVPVKLVPRKPILPSAQELEENPRARSAKLRVAEKLPE